MELAEYWKRNACPDLASAAAKLKLSVSTMRTITLDMLLYSTSLLTTAQETANAAAAGYPDGVSALLAVGSTARGESVRGSDIDFNVYIDDGLANVLEQGLAKLQPTGTDLAALPPRKVLKGYENQLRPDLQPGMLAGLQARGLCTGLNELTFKPFADGHLDISTQPLLAVTHLGNLLFAATAVLGVSEFDRILRIQLADADAFYSGLLGRLCLLMATRERLRSVTGQDLVKTMHTITACLSAILCAGTFADDPMAPYWWSVDLDIFRVYDGELRDTLLNSIVLVTMCRGGAYQRNLGAVVSVLERAVDNLELVADAVIERLQEDREDQRTIDVWAAFRALLLSPDEISQWMSDLGMA